MADRRALLCGLAAVSLIALPGPVVADPVVPALWWSAPTPRPSRGPIRQP